LPARPFTRSIQPDMGVKRWIVLVGVLLGTVILVASAQGGRGSGPLAGIACKRIAPGVCEESGDVTTPPGGTASQTTDTVPSLSNAESTIMQPFNTQELVDFDNLWEGVADGYPKLGKITNVTVRRVITCALISRNVGDVYGAFSKGTMVTRSVAADNANAAILAMCIQAAVTGQQAVGVARDAASANRCSTAVVSFPVQISRSGSRYTISAHTTVSRASRAPLAVSCQAKGKGLVIKVRTRKRGRKLRSVIGAKFGIGYSNHSKKSVGVHVTFRFS
jgi:hypothetical protein